LYLLFGGNEYSYHYHLNYSGNFKHKKISKTNLCQFSYFFFKFKQDFIYFYSLK